MVISGIEEHLRESEYFFLTVIHRHDHRVLQNYSQMLVTPGSRGIYHRRYLDHREDPRDPLWQSRDMPRFQGVTNLILDQKLAARLVLTHLLELGHRDIAFMKGQTTSSDSATRWAAICAACQELGVRIRPEAGRADRTRSDHTAARLSVCQGTSCTEASPLPRYSLITISPQSALSGRFVKPDYVCLRTSRLLDSTMCRWRSFPTPS